LLALTGDSIDNVPGVPKVGPKTAAKWLAQYGTLDRVIANAHEIAGVVGENLRNTIEWLPQGKRLLQVKIDCELGVSPLDLKLVAPQKDKLRSLYDRFEFKQWLRDVNGARPDPAGVIADRAARQDTRMFSDAANAEAAPNPPAPVPRHYETVLDEA